MSKQFKPMLAGNVNLNELIYPVLVSPKFDGVRAVVLDNVVYSRKLIRIPSTLVQNSFGTDSLNNYDGELILGSPTNSKVFRKTNSAVTRLNNNDKVDFYVFDYINNECFQNRYKKVVQLSKLNIPNVKMVEQIVVINERSLLEYEESILLSGYEGVMIRKIDGKYKFGRSTTNEGLLLKLKRFVDNEATVIGFDELLSNQNKMEIDNLGYTKRSGSKENLTPMGMLGALVLKGINGKFQDVIFKLGVGLTHEDRIYIWENRDSILGSIVKYKHFDVGSYDKPRMPSFIGFRSLIDM